MWRRRRQQQTLLGLGVLLTTKASTCTWQQHRSEPNIVLLDVSAGVSIRSAVGRFCEDAGLDAEACSASLFTAIAGRHKYVDVEGVAPYRIQVHVTLPWTCHRLRLEASDDEASAVEVVFDASDDFETLASSTCARATLIGPSCESRVAAELRRLSAATPPSTPVSASCPRARSRRLASGGHACAGPWAIGEAEATRVSCVPSPAPFGNETTCLFRNLYFHDGGWFANDLVDAPPVRLGTRPETPLLRLDTVTPDELAARARESPCGAVLRRGDDALHVLAARWRPFASGEGHGHALHDLALPVFWATFSAGASDQIQLVLVDDDLRAPADEWFETVSARPPLYASHEREFVCRQGCWCALPRALAGLGGRSYFALDLQDPEQASAFSNVHYLFAGFARARLGAGPKPLAATTRVLLVQRLHSRVLANADDLATALREADSPPWDVSTRSLDFLSPRDQIAAVDEVDLVVAVEGGALDLLLLAAPGVAAVVVGRHPALPWPEGCSGCDSETQFTHGPMLLAAAAWLPSARVPCCADAADYAPDPAEVVQAARSVLARREANSRRAEF